MTTHIAEFGKDGKQSKCCRFPGITIGSCTAAVKTIKTQRILLIGWQNAWITMFLVAYPAPIPCSDDDIQL